MCGLSWLVIATGVAGWSICAAFAASGSRATPSPTPIPTPSPPVIEFLAVPNHEVVKRNEPVEVSVLISNKSDKLVQVLDISLAGKNPAGQDAPFTGNLAINSELKPFTSESRNLTITPTNHAPFTQSKLLLMLRYSWNAGKEPVISTQSATITTTVQRPFEEEAKGFPGGTAAFLYFLLPVIPALLSYQVVERYRKGEGLSLPTFKTEQIVPAFFLSVILSFVILSVARSKGGIDYSNPLNFILVLAASAIAGAFWPFVRLLRDSWLSRTWGFKDNESESSYLRKALLSPWSPAEFSWATGEVGKVIWQGILLEQPGGAKVLGAAVQITRSDTVDDAFWENAQQELFDGEAIRDRQKLVEMVASGQLKVKLNEPIMEGNRVLATYVVVRQVKGFQQTNIDVKNLLRPLT